MAEREACYRSPFREVLAELPDDELLREAVPEKKITKIVITGGGTLEYQGFDDIDYYSNTYLTTHGEDRGVYEQAYTKSLDRKSVV